MDIVYGGSFNPPTIAHFKIAKEVINLQPLADFYFLPTGNVYHKSGLVSNRHRINMLKLLCRKLGTRAKVSTAETEEQAFFGTYYTLQKFSNPVFVLGADNLIEIDSWIRYDELVAENRFIVIPREGFNFTAFFKKNPLLQKYRNHFTVLNLGNIDISASNYRKTKDDKYLLPEVAQYIKENNLYKE